MGEAKRRAKQRAKREQLSRPIKPARFDLFAIGSRRSPTRLMADELYYWSDLEERVLGLVFRDTTDNDFGWILLVRDKIGRFRCVDLATSLDSQEYATSALRERIGVAVEQADFLALGDQEDETNYPVDLLRVPARTDPETLHPHFRSFGPRRRVEPRAVRYLRKSALGLRQATLILSASSNSPSWTSGCGNCICGLPFANLASISSSRRLQTFCAPRPVSHSQLRPLPSHLHSRVHWRLIPIRRRPKKCENF